MEIQQQSKVLDQGDLISKLLLKIDASEKRMDKKDVEKLGIREMCGSDFKKHESPLERRVAQQER